MDGGIGLTIGEPGIRITAEVAEGVDEITVAGNSELTGRMRERDPPGWLRRPRPHRTGSFRTSVLALARRQHLPRAWL
ncbi:hypothetical protein DRO03_04930 [Methanosarcinales archaeon]|nr:MAG: hypothetical protein DRO03_04930 [Methanosarcinales archaeon]